MARSALLDPSRREEAADPPTTGQVQRTRQPRSTLTLSAVFAVYAGVALLANYPEWPGDPNRIRGGDLDQMVWYLAWTPHAIAHGQNLFATNWLNYPEGVNLAQNTSAPLLGLVTAPLTLTVSPIASLNLLLWLAFPLSAFSMFLVLHRWVRWEAAAFVGGALYGFSPYVVTQNLEHLNLAFVPLPPVILLCAYETVRPDGDRRLRWGVGLGLSIVAQFYISAEIAATTVVIVVLSGVVLAVARPQSVIQSLRRSRNAFAAAAGIVVAGLAYPTWMMTEGPFRYRGPAYPSGFSADLLSTIGPTKLQMVAPHRLAIADSRLLFGNLSENDSYLGIPLIVLLVVLVWVCRKNGWIRFAGVMGIVTTVLSLGPHLVVHNHVTSIPLPWDLFRHLPLADNIIVARLSLYTAIFATIIVALAMAELRSRWRARAAPTHGFGSSTQFIDGSLRPVWVGLLGLLAALSVLSLLPAWPLKTRPVAVPAFFRSAAADRIPYGSVVLISPYPSVKDVQPQMWQAVARMRFRIIGGYALVPNARGASSILPDVLQPADVQRFLWASATGGSAYPRGRVPNDDTELACQLRGFLLRYQVNTVVSTTANARPRPLDALYFRALGSPDYVAGGATVWFHVQTRVQRGIASCTT